MRHMLSNGQIVGVVNKAIEDGQIVAGAGDVFRHHIHNDATKDWSIIIYTDNDTPIKSKNALFLELLKTHDKQMGDGSFNYHMPSTHIYGGKPSLTLSVYVANTSSTYVGNSISITFVQFDKNGSSSGQVCEAITMYNVSLTNLDSTTDEFIDDIELFEFVE